MKRLDSDKQVNKIWEARSNGKGKRGRPELTWNRAMGDTFKAQNITWEQAGRLLRGRNKWNNLIKEVQTIQRRNKPGHIRHLRIR